MIIGIPKEIKNNEFRVAITASGVHELRSHGHQVLVQSGAGTGSNITDAEYTAAGAQILDSADDVWAQSAMILKVKEPVASEYRHFRPGLILFTYLHLAAEPELTAALLERGVTAIAYETVQRGRSLPLLAPMSEVAGRLSVQVGAQSMMAPAGGPGLLLGGVPGVRSAKVVVLGAGVAGTNAAAAAVGAHADVTVLDINIDRLRELDELYAGRIKTVASNAFEIERAIVDADLVIGSVLIPGARAPKLVTNDMVSRMKPGSVLVDIAVDQGGCFEDSHPTTHEDPTFRVHGSLFYCVANMPGAVPNTSTYALTNVTLPYAVALASLGVAGAFEKYPDLAHGLNIAGGRVTHASVSAAHGLELTSEWPDLVTS
ncbi:alanine dehydrogenase [Arthrobacter jinronghuae]|uniref:Alanine dehydrogenase n=1 Tax=Arthrobacter jinronghuae TaxID=2964609 RepID=A0ABT1NLR5_9MICC|nr:alanine dehydrogenase [Arthrobacter jinronghuae]MCQ1948666.1 alanine dehydrogenase [Arthrobacter jinronghuae]MCQ1951992.1 alanine dehydrogenase [Arthrobacter sp. zg-Y238]MCQ1955872.1 alanine dehydrogenase [Arthrobacter jinronghuae]UWX78521.1 alanine dehydrogenase [Arthrobacter jinronghuae]